VGAGKPATQQVGRVIVDRVKGPQIYRPTSALADFTEIIGHWHAPVGYRSRALLAESRAQTKQSSAPIVVRTRLYDEALLRAHVVSQTVILAAGMDARSYRLPWPDGATVFEVDQPQVIAIKDDRLAGEQPRCRRVAGRCRSRDDWPKELGSQGFDSAASTVWLIEGLLQYLEESDVDRLFARVDGLSAPGSVLLYDVVGTALLAAPFSADTLAYMEKLGAP
jgi:methyltransferase (TIGR00027 family)